MLVSVATVDSNTYSPRVTPDEIIEGEKRMLRRLRRTDEEPKMESSSAEVVQTPYNEIFWDMGGNEFKMSKSVRAIVVKECRLP